MVAGSNSQGENDMATIGTFKKSGTELQGEIVTLSVQAKGVRIVPSKKLTCSDRARNSIAPRDYRPLVPPTRVAKVSCPVGRAKARWRTETNRTSDNAP